jgi:DNA polymerase-3 subunit alpha
MIFNMTWLGFFQYESAGMQKYMKELPTFPDLIAVYLRTNCLYPEFCKRKNGEEEIIYDLEACEELLKIPMALPFIKNR